MKKIKDLIKTTIFCFCIFLISIGHDIQKSLPERAIKLDDFIYLFLLIAAYVYIYKLLRSYLVPLENVSEDMKAWITKEADSYYKRTGSSVIGLGILFIVLYSSTFIFTALSQLGETPPPIPSSSNFLIPALVLIIIGVIIKARGAILYLFKRADNKDTQ